MKVLHLVHPPSAGDAAIRRLHLLLRDAPADHAPLIIGGTGDEARARRLGLDTHDRLAPPLRRPELAVLPLRRFLRRREVDVIHAWSAECLVLAALAGVAQPIVATLGLPPDTRRSRLRAGLVRHAASRAVVCFNNPWTRAQWLDQTGASPPTEHLVPNAFVDAEGGTPREALRAGWGVDDDTLVILTGGDPIARQPSRLLMYVAALTVYSGQPAAVVLTTGPRDMERTRRFDVNYGGPWRLIIDDRPREDLLVGCDVALWHHATSGIGATGAPVGIDVLEHAAVRGIPVIAGEHPLLADLRATCAERPHAERPVIDLIQQILHVRKDPESVRRQSDAIRHAARERHDPSRWVRAYRDIYATCVG